MSLLKRFCSHFTGNALAQRALEYNVRFSQYLMGVGAGTKVHSSGELGLVRLLQSWPSRPLRVFDVGANVGQFAGLLRENFQQRDIELHSFEPGAEAFAQLQQSLADWPAARANRCALGSEPGLATLYSDVAASGLSSLIQRDLEHVGKSMTLCQVVQVDTVDAYCERHGIRHIDLLKIDVEGHECEVLAGAAKLFERGTVRAVTFEFGGCNIDSRTYFRDFWQFFREQGMTLHRLTPRGYLRRIDRYRESHEQFVTTNYLAIAPEQAATLEHRRAA
ncbi:MAG: FkbM family methyltransferase [Planctomycetaceae bacterium]